MISKMRVSFFVQLLVVGLGTTAVAKDLPREPINVLVYTAGAGPGGLQDGTEQRRSDSGTGHRENVSEGERCSHCRDNRRKRTSWSR